VEIITTVVTFLNYCW